MSLIDLFMPQGVKCIFCKREVSGFNICEECYKSLHFITDNICPICGGISDNGDNPCRECIDKKVYFKRIFCVLSYEDEIVGKLSEIKNKNKKAYLYPLAKLMADKFNETTIPFDMILPIPITEDRLSERGFNQAAELASEIKEIYGRVYDDVLLKSRITPHQTGLSRENRKVNLENSFMIKDKSRVKGKIILLIDDVFATGATVNECSRMLKEAGVESIKVAVICISHTLK
jgi:ComF family protein